MLAGRMQSKLAVVIAGSLALAALGVGSAGAATVSLVGSKSKSGSFAFVNLTKDAAGPHAMYYKVTTSPSGLPLDIQVLIHCTRGAKTKQKNYPLVHTTSTPRVKVPVTLSGASQCTLSVGAGLHSGSGKVTVKIYKS